VPTFEPSQFQVNEAWIAFKLNDIPVATEADGDFNVIALMDAASCFILGIEFVPADAVEPSRLESKRLLQTGKSHHQLFPGRLFISTELAAAILSAEAEREGISVVRVSEADISVFVREAREGFKEHVSRGELH
jgi:hypothetical protein